MTLQSRLDALKTALTAVPGLRVHTVSPGSVAPPAAIIEVAQITVPSTFGGSADYQVRIVLLVQKGDQRNSQERTYALIDPEDASSVASALAAADEVSQLNIGGPALIEYGGSSYVGSVIEATLF